MAPNVWRAPAVAHAEFFSECVLLMNDASRLTPRRAPWSEFNITRPTLNLKSLCK